VSRTPATPERFSGTSRFDVLDVLGRGGMGVVYEAFDRERNTRVALKTLRTLTPDSLMQLKNEFRTLQDLQHPNLVRLDELFEAEGTWFFTMERVDGDDFLRHVRRAVERESPFTSASDTVDQRPRSFDTETVTAVRDGAAGGPGRGDDGRSFDEARLRHALAQLVQGLHALHTAGKVHRDVKPANVLVTRDGRVVLLDFGLITDAFLLPLERRTVGTVAYMAPEQIVGEPVGPAADWYAVGVTLYHALTGHPPFVGSPAEIVSLKQRVEPVPPGDLVDDVPEDLDRLCADLLRRNPARRPGGDEILQRLGLDPSAALLARGAPFVGRELELAILDDAFHDVAPGHAVAVLVHGESGVGKTALVRRFAAIVASRALVLGGRCYERESVPYNALDQVMDQLSRQLAALPVDAVAALLPPRIALVAEVFPALRKVRPIDAAMARVAELRSADPFQNRRALFETVRELWSRLAAQRTVIVTIDDLQWADADSLALLAHLVQGPDAPAVVLCATVRTAPETAAERLGALRLRLGDDVRELAVERLPPAAARELVEHLARTAGAELPLDAVATEAGGHPMFIEALVRHRVLHPGSVGPLRLDDALVERAAEIEPLAADLLDLVCVAGGPISQGTCELATGTPFAELDPVISRLRAIHLVRTQGARRADPIEAYHDRVREAVLARSEPSRRRALHGRLARALEAAGDADPEQLATHFAEAGEPAAAARYADRASQRALGALAFEQAARLCRRALDLDPTSEAAPRLRIRLGEALGNAGRGRDAAEVYLAAAEDAAPEQQLDLRRRAAEQLLVSGRIDDGLRVLRTVLDSVGLRLPGTPRRALASLLLHRAQVRLRGGGARFHLREPDDSSPARWMRIDTCWSASMGLAIVDPIRGSDFQAQHLLLALDAGEPYRLACAIAAEAAFSGVAGGPARRHTERMVRVADSLAAAVGHPNALGYASFAAGTADYLVGRWRSAVERCDRATAIFRDRCAGVTWWIDTARYFALECLAYSGDLAEMGRRVPEVIADAEARGDLYAAVNARIGVPNLVWLFADDVAEARRQIDEAMAAWSHEGFHVQHIAELLARGQADLYAGEGAAAYQRVTGAWAAITRTAIFRVQLTRIATYQQRARAALAAALAAPAGSSERRALVADARRCARRIARERMAWSDPLAALARAGAAHLDDDPEDARLELGRAIAGFDAVDMAACAAAARRRLAAIEGGDAGAALLAAAPLPGVRRPDRMTDVLAPGF